MRQHLQRSDPTAFPWGRYTRIQYILDYLLGMSHSVTLLSVSCPNDHPLNRADLASSSQITILCQCRNIQAFVDDQSIECVSHCHVCQSQVIWQHTFEDTPAIIAFDLSQISLLESIVISTTVNGHHMTYKLRGMMYHLDDHFTLRFILETGCVWYHDGISTGRQMVHEGSLGNTELGMCQSGMATCAIYVIL